jgi:hypothetical protein
LPIEGSAAEAQKNGVGEDAEGRENSQKRGGMWNARHGEAIDYKDDG